MALGACVGCGSALEFDPRTKPRKWCSEACRVRTFRSGQPSPPPASPTVRQCTECGVSFSTVNRKTCSPGCAKARTNRLRRESKGWGAYIHTRRARQYAAKQEPINRFRVADRDGWLCGICDDPIDQALAYPDPGSLSMDHVVPISLGGAHSEENLRATHLHCNLVRGTKAA